MTFTSDTVIQQSPGSWKQAETYEKGDPISAASSSGPGWSWTESAVVAVLGGEPRTDIGVYIKFGDGGELVVSLDQPMMIKGGTMKAASDLVPEADSLVGSDGTLLPVLTVMLGEVSGRFFGIVATSEQWQGNLNGHLLDCAGVICGDYLVQIRLGDEQNR